MDNIDFDTWLQKTKESLAGYEKSLARFNEFEFDINKADANNFSESLMQQFTEEFGTEYDETAEQIFSLLEKMFRVFLVLSPAQRRKIIDTFSGRSIYLIF
jgi:hypothetical protein